jgi:molybdopterin-guanine dinucleotide biosynthesis protein B
MTSLPAIPVIAVVGSRHSGKTTTTEAIIKGLVKKGYKTATAKHIHQKDFTIDTKNRDTWKHTKAGAQTTIAVAQNELTTIRKINTTKLTIKDITHNCPSDTDVIILEGFRGLIAQDQTVPKIVTAKNKTEINEAQKTFKPILAISTPLPKQKTDTTKTPQINVLKEPKKLTDIIDQRISPIIKKRGETQETVNIEINGQNLPLNPYVQKITRNVLLSMISTLKGTNIKGNENIQITITNPNKPTNKLKKSQKSPKTTKTRKKYQIDEPIEE